MEQRMYEGHIDPQALAEHLRDTWDRGETAAQVLEGDEGLIVQIGRRTGGFFSDEPRSAATLALEPVSDGLRVTLGEQQWYRSQAGQIMVGGLIGFFPFFFTWPLRGGRDEPVDPDLVAQVWESVEEYARRYGDTLGEARRQWPRAATGETTRLSGVWCPSCGASNAAGAERCRECGTFLQSRDCPQCGVSNPATANFCMRCGANLSAARAVGG